MITLINFSLGYLSALMIIVDNYVFSAVLLCTTICVDGMDGTYARASDQTSDVGAMLDSVIDIFTMWMVFSVIGIRYPIAFYGLLIYALNILFWNWRHEQYSLHDENVSSRITYRSYFVGVTAEKTFLSCAITLHQWWYWVLPFYILVYYSCIVLRMIIHYKRTKTMLQNTLVSGP